jgi:hypothetical protein
VPDPENANAESASQSNTSAEQSSPRITRLSAFADRVAEPRRFRLRVALALAAISLISAYVSYVASERDATAAGLNALAAQQSAEEQQVEQQLEALVAGDVRLTARLDEFVHTYRSDLADAQVVGPTDPDSAALLQLDAQANWARYTALRPFLYAAQPVLNVDEAVYGEKAALSSLRQMDGRLFRASSDLTKNEAQHVAESTSTTILSVVLLVASLFLLTLAHLIRGRRGVLLAATGMSASAVGILVFASVDILAAVPIIITAIVLVAAMFIVRIPRVHARLRGLDRDDTTVDVMLVASRPDVMATPGAEDQPDTGLTKYVAVTIAVATLLGAGVGFLHGSASADARRESWAAVDLGVRSIGALRVAEEELAVKLDTYKLALINRVDGWSADQQSLYAAASGDVVESARAAAAATRLSVVADRQEKLSGLEGRLSTTEGVNLEALSRLRAQVWEESSRLAAIQDAANSAARTLDAEAGKYLAVLAWLAVAAYLLGLSLIFRTRRVRLVLTATGSVLVVAAAAGTLIAHLSPAPPTAASVESSAEAYATGMVALVGGDSAVAADQFEKATDLRPDFGIANRELAQSIMSLGSEPGLGIRAAFTDTSVDKALKALEAARANHADTAGVNLNMGAMLFHRAIRTESLADMRQSVAFTRAGLQLGDAYDKRDGGTHINRLIGEMNLGLGLLAVGDADEATAVYRNVGDEIATLPVGLRSFVVSAGLTPLERLFQSSMSASEKEITAAKEALLSSGYDTNTKSAPKVEWAQPALSTSVFQWHASITGFDSARDDVSVQWYRYNEATETWNGLWLVSGPLSFQGTELGEQPFYPDTAGNSVYWGNTAAELTDVPSTCVLSGQYKMDLYVNGELQASKEVAGPSADSSPLVVGDGSAAMCAPPEWPVSSEPGRWTTVASPDGSRGVSVFHVHEPQSLAGADHRISALERVVRAELSELSIDAASGVEPQPSTRPIVLGTSATVWRSYSSASGTVNVAATDLGAGIVTVVCQFGPTDWVNSAEAVALLETIVRR